MVVLLLEHVPSGVRGELTRWLLEPRTGVFVGKVSAMVRDRLWDRVCRARTGGALLVHAAEGEQGYVLQVHGDPKRVPVDFDGLTLIRLP